MVKGKATQQQPHKTHTNEHQSQERWGDITTNIRKQQTERNGKKAKRKWEKKKQWEGQRRNLVVERAFIRQRSFTDLWWFKPRFGNGNVVTD